MMDLTANLPVLCVGFAAQCMRAPQLPQYGPRSVHLLDSFVRHRNTVVDIACKERTNGCYSGDDKSRQNVELKFGDFLDYYQAAFTKQPHWLQTVDDLEFYLCQCPIAVYKPDATCTKASLPAVMGDFCIPACLDDKPVSQVNLWMSAQPCRTSLHYDAYQNILVILYGRKIVTLYPPSESDKLYPYPIYTKSANHSQVNVAQPDHVAHPRFAEAQSQQFAVSAGDALFIPEGWWHQVDSDEFTIAVNYWWEGMRNQLTADPHMTPYYSRILLEELVKQQIDSHLLALSTASYSTSALTNSLPQDDGIVTSVLLAATSQCGRERILLPLNSEELLKVQRRLAEHHAADWRDLLTNASVDLVAILTKCWDRTDLEADFLSVIFGALGDEEEAIKTQLVVKQEQFRRLQAALVFESLFGSS